MRFDGAGTLIVAPRPAHFLVAFRIEAEAIDDLVTLREDRILGFELGAVGHDSGRLPLGDGDVAQVVQFRALAAPGPGQGGAVILLELLEPLEALDVAEGRPVLVRRDSLVGWTGRASPRALPPAEAPGGQRGLLSFTGEGTVLLTDG
jgi:hypothetical protein